jgi:hypothetical protein
MSNNPHDAGIPVLTEVIPAPALTAVPETPPAPAPAPSPASLEARATTTWNEEDWSRLEREVRERVLVQILERVDFVLEQRVRDSLADVLQTAVDGLASDLKSGLHHSIKDAVTRAVTQEITKLQGTKK